MALPPKKYAKPFLTFAQQVALLESRGLVVSDRQAAEKFLAHVNYYRLSGYCFSFENPRHVFLKGTTFAQVKALYDFDHQLRALVSELLHFVEISARTTIAYQLGSRYGALAHTDAASCQPPQCDSRGAPILDAKGRTRHQSWLDTFKDETRRSTEIFVEHFRDNYEVFPDGLAKLPVWTAVEVMSFGTVSKLYRLLKVVDQDAIASKYQVHRRVLGTWLHALAFVRNVCAHHGRLWNRHLSITPAIPYHDAAWATPPTSNPSRICTILFLLNYLARNAPHVHFEPAGWRGRIEALLAGDPGVPQFKDQMGFPSNWPKHPLWV